MLPGGQNGAPFQCVSSRKYYKSAKNKAEDQHQTFRSQKNYDKETPKAVLRHRCVQS